MSTWDSERVRTYALRLREARVYPQLTNSIRVHFARQFEELTHQHDGAVAAERALADELAASVRASITAYLTDGFGEAEFVVDLEEALARYDERRKS